MVESATIRPLRDRQGRGTLGRLACGHPISIETISSGTASPSVPYQPSSFAGGPVSAEKSLFEGLWDTISSAMFNVFDSYGWIIPAVLLTMLLLGILVLISYAMEDLPIDAEIFDGVGGIFRCTRRWWKGNRSD